MSEAQTVGNIKSVPIGAGPSPTRNLAVQPVYMEEPDQSHPNYPWWDLEGGELVGLLYNILAPFQLTDHTYQDWDDFGRKDPDFAYAWSVGSRLHVLEEAIIALRPIVQMLGVTEFPIPSKVRAIDRYVWISATIDLALFRISVIRDCSYVLVNAVFELGINPRELSLRRLKREEVLREHQC
jgi:hypothetical protein